VRVFPPWGLDLSRGTPVSAAVAHGGIGHGRRAHDGRDGCRGRIRWDSWSFGRGRERGGSLTGPHGTVAALTGVTDPAVSVTGTGGTLAISTTGSGDHTLDATVSWACP
jgi:hypothetical protein